MTKTEKSIQEIITYLLESDWTPDGLTDQKSFRISTVKSPVFGGSGGELVALGGRQRFISPKGNMKVTIGKKSTYFYFPEKDIPYYEWKGKYFKTSSEINEIKEYIKNQEINNEQ